MRNSRQPRHGVVLITGASAGIGRELAFQFAGRSATLILVARELERLEQVRADLRARHAALPVMALAADLADEGQVDGLLVRVAEQAGPVDVLVNNAGSGDWTLFDRSEWARTRQVLRTNVLAVAQLTAALVPGMVSRRRGGVLNMGSGAGLTVLPSGAAYVGSKHFVAGFSEALRADLAGTGVVVTQVCPGPVNTQFEVSARGRMTAGLPGFLRIGPTQCAREAVAGFERGEALVLPGRAYRSAMRLLPFAPLSMRRWQAARVARRLRALQGES